MHGFHDGAVDVAGLHGLDDEAIHPGFQTALSIAFHGVCGHGDDGEMTGAGLPPANLRGSFQAIHLGHLHVHEGQVKLAGFGGGDRGAAILHHGDGMPALLQQPPRHHLVDLIVLGQQDVQTARPGGTGLDGLGRGGQIASGAQERNQGCL